MATWEDLPDVQTKKDSWEDLPDVGAEPSLPSRVLSWLKEKGGNDTRSALTSAAGYGGTLPGQDPLKGLEDQPQSVKGLAAKRDEEQLAQMLSLMQGGSSNHVGKLSGLLFGDKAGEQASRLADEAVDRYPGWHVAGAVATSGPAAESVPARIGIAGLLSAASAEGGAKDHSALYAGGGGLAGAGIAAGLEGVTHGASKLAPWLKDLARNQTIRSLNPGKADIRMLERSGIKDAVADDLLGSGAIKFGRTVDQTAVNVERELATRGAELGDVKKGIDSATGGATVLPDVAADSVEDIARQYLGLPHPESQHIGEDLMSRADTFRNFNDGKPLSLMDAEAKLKAPLDKYAERMARTPGTPPQTVEALAQARRAIKTSNEGAAEASANVLAPDLAGKFVPAKQAYGRMAAAADIMERNGVKGLANRALSPSDYGFGIATGQAYQPPNLSEIAADPVQAASGSLVGFLGAQAHKVVRERGNTAAAVAANVGSNLMSPVGAAVQPLAQGSTAAGASGATLLEQYLGMMDPEQRDKFSAQAFVSGTGGH